MIAIRCKLAGVAGILAALLAACHSAPTRLYMVQPLAPKGAPVEYRGPAIRVDAVHIPAALDRREIVTEIAPGEFKVSDIDQWIAPLGQEIRQALTADLAARLPPGRVIFPHLGKPPETISVSVDLLYFGADQRGAKLQVGWLATADGVVPRSRQSTMILQATLSETGPASIAAALSTLLAQLADHIVEGLMQLPDDAST